MCCVNLINLGSGEHQVAIRRKGLDFARRALDVIGEDPRALVTAAFALAAFGEDIAAMIALVDRGLALNPSSARGWFLSGCLRLWNGQPDLAIDHVRKAQRLNPRAQGRATSSYSYVIGAALFFTRRFEEAAAELVLAIHCQLNFPTPYRYLAACYAHTGLLCEAREVMARLRAITPVPIPDFPLPLRNPVDRELYLSGLRLAAAEET
jgi:tetratricopeptide (TPR) repeat protein